MAHATSDPAPKTFELAPEAQAAVFRKVSLRLLPFIFLLYMANILDRVNVGFAKLDMLPDLQMSDAAYALGGSIFYIGYFLFEVPSNLMLRRMGARVWIGRIIISWGIISTCMMFVTGPVSFFVLRALLGIAEAGFFPGIIYYLSCWFPARTRARAMSRFMTASALSGVVGQPLSGALMHYLDQVGGLRGWQWVFLVEGIPTVLLGLFALYYLTDRPGQADWLAPEERDWLAARMDAEERHREERHGLTLWQTLGDGRVWLLAAIYFMVSMGANSYGLYGPTILSMRLPDANKLQIGLVGALPALAAAACMVVVGWSSDRTRERRAHVGIPAFVSVVGWVLAASTQDLVLSVLGLAIAYAGMMSMLAPFWSLPTSFLSGAAAAGGIAFINSLGNLGGFVAPNVIGRIQTQTDRLEGGMWFLAGGMVLGGILPFFLRHDSSLDRKDMH
jgi:ACS family tartrate transporter-like MFS transporter